MKKNDILLFITGFFIIVFVSILYSVYSKLTTSTISDTLTTHIQPIAPTFNTAIIDVIKKRRNVSPLSESLTQPSSSVSASTQSNEVITPASSAGSIN